MYHFDYERLVIKDAGIDYDEPFKPPLIPKNPAEGMEVAGGYRVSARVQSGEYRLVKDGVVEGQYLIEYPSGALKHESFYKGGRLHGPARFFGPKGQKLTESWWIEGLSEGEALWYYPSGALYSRQFFRGGKWDGVQEYFHPDGRRKSAIVYSMGTLVRTL